MSSTRLKLLGVLIFGHFGVIFVKATALGVQFPGGSYVGGAVHLAESSTHSSHQTRSSNETYNFNTTHSSNKTYSSTETYNSNTTHGSNETNGSKVTQGSNKSSSNSSITFDVPTMETYILKYTYSSLGVFSGPITEGTVTGGSLGKAKYKFFKFLLTWHVDGDDVTFEIYVFYYNAIYSSPEEAGKKGGFVLVKIVVYVVNKDNPRFNPFLAYMKIIKKPGNSIPVSSLPTYNYFDKFNQKSTYNTYTASVYDTDTGRTFNSVFVVELNPESRNFISRKQFNDAFGDGEKNMPPPQIQRNSQQSTNTGVEVVPK